ncbi:hypothetical protein HZP67_09920 [Elizabethkingia anophelis]|nr:hypothetical protein [Elizabethkingia anophelis]MCT4148158.1 hypothetical protein [Elizabethkingia anophelis]
MEREIWYDLDPDNNKKDLEIGLFCCRCKRKLKEIKSFISVEQHPDHYWVRINPIGKHLLGSECAKKLEKVPIEIIVKYG